MTDKTEWLDWACLDWTGVGKWTGEWPRSSHSPSIVESGHSSSFFAICCVVWLFLGATGWGELRSPLISTAGHWLEPDRPQGPVVLSESILGRSFPHALRGTGGRDWDWAGDWDRD